MRVSPAVIQPSTLILDTGPLWELILYAAVHDLGYARLEPDLQFLRSGEGYRNLTAYLAQFRYRMTTPHVVAEMSARIYREIKNGQEEVWKLVYSEFTKMGMDEKTLRLLLMPEDLVVSMGVVDVSLLKVASSMEPGSSTVLSIDGDLIAECRRASLLAQHLSEIIWAELS